MSVFVPNYYEKFHCIADACQHSCCVGWEIDIDEQSFLRYRKVDGDFGNRLQQAIAYDGKTASFRLTTEERCPFLNQNNLCDMILTLGENSLCQICRDHPRFRNYLSDRTEISLGLCCEEAARLILTDTEPFSLHPIHSLPQEQELVPWETELLSARKTAFSILQNRKFPMQERLEELQQHFQCSLPKKSLTDWTEIYLKLERLDSHWGDLLNLLKRDNKAFKIIPNELEIPLEQLSIYFLYRHLLDAQDPLDFQSRILFSVLSTQIIFALYSVTEHSISNFLELARLYSSEIEYSEDNMDTLLCIL